MKNFYFVDKFRDKQFRAGGFQGTRVSPYENRKFNTRAARTNSVRNIPKLNTPYQTNEVTTRNAPEARRQVTTRALPGVREASIRGTAQGALDRENAPRNPLTLDEVKEILNRSK